MIGLARARRGGLARPLLTLLGLLLLAGYVLVSDGTRLLAKEHDDESGPRECVEGANVHCSGDLSISGLGTSLNVGSSDGFELRATNLVTTTTSPYTLVASVPNDSSTGFNSNCSDKSESWQIQPGPASHTQPVTLYACRWTSAGTRVTASLNHSGHPIPGANPSKHVTVNAFGPHKVTGVSVSRSGERGIKVTWSVPSGAGADGGANLTGYHVQHNEGTSGWPATADTVTPGSATMHTIQGIFPTRTYKVRVRACNAASLCGSWSDERTSVPPESTPTPTPTATAVPASAPGKVTGVTVTRSSDGGALEVTWDIPAEHGSADLSGFHVQHNGGTDGWLATADTVTPGTATMHTIANAFSDRTYSVRVQACNKASLCGNWSDGVQEGDEPDPPPTTVTAPERVRNLRVTAEETSLRVRWSAPSNNGGAAITRYDVQHKETSASWPPESQATRVTTTQTRITGLTSGTTYEVRVRACNGPNRCGSWRSTDDATTETVLPTLLMTPVALGQTCTSVSAPDSPHAKPSALDKPTGLAVIPYAGRRAALVWEPVADAADYVIQVREFGSTSEWVTLRDDSGTRPCYRINLDAISGSDKGLAQAKAFEFQVQAAWGSQSNHVASLYSEPIIVIDTPINKANGHSPLNGPGKATLHWGRVESILSDQSYAGGTYSFLARKFADNPSHSDPRWRPTSFSEARIRPSNRGYSDTIPDLTLEAVYAIQLRYEKSGLPPVYAARDVYVWPSDAPTQDGDRVATFPVTSRLEFKTFRYRICTDTFSPEGGDRTNDWIKLINHAFEQWQTATSNLITTGRQPTACEDYTALIDDIVAEVVRLLAPRPQISESDLRTKLREFLDNVKDEMVLSLDKNDRSHSDIRLYNDVDYDDVAFLRQTGAFSEVADDIGNAKDCWYENDIYRTNVLICTVPTPSDVRDSAGNLLGKRFTSDIIIRRAPFKDESITAAASDPRFNACPNENDRAYSAFLHEVGHALGIGGGDAMKNGAKWDSRGHPNNVITDSVMGVYRRDLCSPTPFDVMAIYALYQSR